jgi:hypothetical protein
MQKIILIIIVITLSSPVCFSQIKNNYESEKWDNEFSAGSNYYVNSELTAEKKYKIGFNPGYHFQNLDNLNGFSGDVLFEFYLGFILSDEVSVLMGYSFWKAETQQISNPGYMIPSENINSNAFKLGLEFSLFEIYSTSLLLGTSVSIGNLSGAVNSIFAFGSNLKLSTPILQERLSLFTSANYQKGVEVLNFGGGSHYSFFGISIGLEIFI